MSQSGEAPGSSKHPPTTKPLISPNSKSVTMVFQGGPLAEMTSKLSVEPSAKASQTILTSLSSRTENADFEFSQILSTIRHLQGSDTHNILHPQPAYQVVLRYGSEFELSSDSPPDDTSTEAQVLWVNERFSREDEYGHAEIIVPSEPDHPSSSSDSSSYMSDQGYARKRRRRAIAARKKALPITSSFRTLKPPPTVLNESVTEADTDPEDDDDSDYFGGRSSSTGFSLHASFEGGQGRNNMRYYHLAGATTFKEPIQGSNDDHIYNADTLGQRELFWPLMTPSERRLVGAPSQIEITPISPIIPPPTHNNQDPTASPIAQSPSETLVFVRDFATGISTVLDNYESAASVLIRDISENGNDGGIMQREYPNPVQTIVQPNRNLRAISTSTTELEELTRDEFPEDFRRCKVM